MRLGANPAKGSFRIGALVASFRKRRRRAAHFVGKRGPRRPRRRLGHLRLEVMIEGVGPLPFGVGPGRIRQRRHPRRRLGAGAAAAATDPVRASRARYWVPRRCRSGRRSSADARHCRAAPAPAACGHPRRRHRSPPDAASARDWCWRRAGCRRIGEPARRRARSAPARPRMRRKMSVPACLSPANSVFFRSLVRRTRFASDAATVKSLRSAQSLNTLRQKLPPRTHPNNP